MAACPTYRVYRNKMIDIYEKWLRMMQETPTIFPTYLLHNATSVVIGNKSKKSPLEYDVHYCYALKALADSLVVCDTMEAITWMEQNIDAVQPHIQTVLKSLRENYGLLHYTG